MALLKRPGGGLTFRNGALIAGTAGDPCCCGATPGQQVYRLYACPDRTETDYVYAPQNAGPNPPVPHNPGDAFRFEGNCFVSGDPPTAEPYDPETMTLVAWRDESNNRILADGWEGIPNPWDRDPCEVTPCCPENGSQWDDIQVQTDRTACLECLPSRLRVTISGVDDSALGDWVGSGFVGQADPDGFYYGSIPTNGTFDLDFDGPIIFPPVGPPRPYATYSLKLSAGTVPNGGVIAYHHGFFHGWEDHPLWPADGDYPMNGKDEWPGPICPAFWGSYDECQWHPGGGVIDDELEIVATIYPAASHSSIPGPAMEINAYGPGGRLRFRAAVAIGSDAGNCVGPHALVDVIESYSQNERCTDGGVGIWKNVNWDVSIVDGCPAQAPAKPGQRIDWRGGSATVTALWTP